MFASGLQIVEMTAKCCFWWVSCSNYSLALPALPTAPVLDAVADTDMALVLAADIAVLDVVSLSFWAPPVGLVSIAMILAGVISSSVQLP
jgi:hypothetical protein